MPQILDDNDHPDYPEPVVRFEQIQAGLSPLPGYAFLRLPEYVIAFLDTPSIDAIIAALRDLREQINNQPKGGSA